MEPARVIDLYAGGGGFTRGFEEAGFRTIAAIEWDWAAAETYRENFPHVRLYNVDIRELDAERVEKDVGRPDVIIGGPPCEPYTVANARRRKEPLERLYDDPMGRLVLHFVRFVGDLQPEAFVMENVLGVIEGDLKEALRYEFGRVGYEVKFNVLHAEDYGVPSRRTRVFVSNVRIKPKRERRRTVWDAIGDLPDPQEEPGIPNHEFRPLPKRLEEIIHKIHWGKAAVYFRGARGNYRNFVRLRPDEPAPTVMGSARFIHPFSDRLLTVRENARLMGFPDHHVFLGPVESQYDQVGEAVPPPLARKIAEELARRL